MSFDEMFDLTAEVYFFFIIFSPVHISYRMIARTVWSRLHRWLHLDSSSHFFFFFMLTIFLEPNRHIYIFPRAKQLRI